MNPFASVSWLWRAWRARSVTFAALFALSLLGISVLTLLRRLLRGIGIPWYVGWLVPLIVVALIARKEEEWLPAPEDRRKWALRVVIGGILLSLLVAKLTPKRSEFTAPVPAQRSERGGLPAR